MKLAVISPDKLKDADKFQEKILNPEYKRRYRPFSYIRKHFLKNPELFVGAYQNRKIIGIVFGYVKKGNVLLGEMAIDEKYRRRGVGSKLLNFFESQVIKIGKTKIINGARENAQNFYFNRGYKPVLFLQIKHSKLPKNYCSICKYKIIKETNYLDAKRLFFEVKKPSNALKNRLIKIFHAYDGIYLFEKELIKQNKE